jgi:hypothetical protein
MSCDIVGVTNDWSMEDAMNDTPFQQLLDRDEIARLVYRLGVALDEGRFEELRSIFTPDATASTPGGKASGIDAVVAQAARNHTPDARTQHVIANVLTDIDGSGSSATVRAKLVVVFAAPQSDLADGAESPIAPPATFTLGETYAFTAARTPSGWRLSSVETIPLWSTGTLPPR